MASWVFAVFLVLCLGNVNCKPHNKGPVITQDTYKAAVLDKAPMLHYQLQRILPRQDALLLIQDFVELFQKTTADAAAQVKTWNNAVKRKRPSVKPQICSDH